MNMISIKTLNLKYSEADLEKVAMGKKRGETWEEYIFRMCVLEVNKK